MATFYSGVFWIKLVHDLQDETESRDFTTFYVGTYCIESLFLYDARSE